MMVFKRLAVILALLVTACATSSTRFLGDGSFGHHIICESVVLGMADCLKKANDVCGSGGYQVVNQNGYVVPLSPSYSGVPSNGSKAPGVAASENYSGGFSPSSQMLVNPDMIVRCNHEPSPVTVLN